MSSFGAVALLRWHQTDAWFFLLFGLRDWIAAYFFWVRRQSRLQGGFGSSVVAYLSSGLPLFYSYPSGQATIFSLMLMETLTVFGFLLVTLATIELADRFGVSPALRGEVCGTGVYRLFRHPMYVGYAIAEAGFLAVNPLNLAIYIPSLILYFWRSRVEDKILRHNPVLPNSR